MDFAPYIQLDLTKIHKTVNDTYVVKNMKNKTLLSFSEFVWTDCKDEENSKPVTDDNTESLYQVVQNSDSHTGWNGLHLEALGRSRRAMRDNRTRRGHQNHLGVCTSVGTVGMWVGIPGGGVAATKEFENQLYGNNNFKKTEAIFTYRMRPKKS